MIKRDPKWGGDKVYTSYEEVEKDFAEEVGGVHISLFFFFCQVWLFLLVCICIIFLYNVQNKMKD